MNPTPTIISRPLRLAFVLFLFCLCPSLFAQDNAPTLTKSFTLNGSGQLKAEISSGGISVEGTSGNTVEIAVFIRKNNELLSSSHPLVERLKEGFELKMEKTGGTVEIYSKRINRSREWQRMSLNFRLKVPQEMAGEIRSSGGGIQLSNLSGNQNLRSSGGGIKMNDISGLVKAVTSGGGIQVNNQSGAMDLQSSGGGISVMDSRGNIIASTSGGGVRLKNVNGTVDAKSSGGRIDVSGEVGAVKAVSSGGGITVDISGLREKLYLKTSGGGINATIPGGLGLDLELKAIKVNVDLPRDFSGNISKNSVVGKVNGGGIPLFMQASGGNVKCNFN